jgi:hypothetical protein
VPHKSPEARRVYQSAYRQRPESKARRKRYYNEQRKDPAKVELQRLRQRKSDSSLTAILLRRRRYVVYRADPAKVVVHRQRVKEWTKRNWASVLARNVAYRNRLNRTDPWWCMRNRLSSRVWHAIAEQWGKKAIKTQTLLGCTVEQARQYIESLFTDGMSWDKFLAGEIHIDHKVPCVHFDLTDPKEQRRCFHFTNLQPLWAADNLRKGAA